VVLDKTGTLTDSEACFLEELRHDSSSGVEEADLRLMLAAAERSSNHPIAAAFERLDEGAMNRFVVESLSILAGRGIRARLRDKRNQRTSTIAITNGESGDNRLRRIEIAVDDRPAATAFIGERLHPVVSEAMEAFKRLGLRRLVATGDLLERAVRIPAEERHASLRPAEKTELVARLQRTGRRVLFVCDGLNDSGAMAVSHASIAVRGSAPLAAGVASAVLNHDDLAALPKAVEEARRALSVARTNLGFAASYNALGMTIAAAGVLHPVTAAILMTCSSLFVSWRSSRLLPEEEYVS
jgi:P-type E1-E2 ATPase